MLRLPELRRHILKRSNKVQQIQCLGLMQRLGQRHESELEGLDTVFEPIEFFSSIFFHEGSSVKLKGVQVGSLQRHSNGMNPRPTQRWSR